MVNPSPPASRVGDKSPLSVFIVAHPSRVDHALCFSVKWTRPPGFFCIAMLPNFLFLCAALSTAAGGDVSRRASLLGGLAYLNKSFNHFAIRRFRKLTKAAYKPFKSVHEKTIYTVL